MYRYYVHSIGAYYLLSWIGRIDTIRIFNYLFSVLFDRMFSFIYFSWRVLISLYNFRGSSYYPRNTYPLHAITGRAVHSKSSLSYDEISWFTRQTDDVSASRPPYVGFRSIPAAHAWIFSSVHFHFCFYTIVQHRDQQECSMPISRNSHLLWFVRVRSNRTEARDASLRHRQHQESRENSPQTPCAKYRDYHYNNMPLRIKNYDASPWRAHDSPINNVARAFKLWVK